MRNLIVHDPFADPAGHPLDLNLWPAFWIGPEPSWRPAVMAFHLDVPPTSRPVRLHVSADQRYELYVDGERVGVGPERCDLEHWHFETYDLPPAAAPRRLAARVWWLIPEIQAPQAQMTSRAAFLCAAEGADPALFNTGFAPWRFKLLDGYGFIPPQMALGTGAKLRLTADALDRGFTVGGGGGWDTPHNIQRAAGPRCAMSDRRWHLHPATLPPMRDQTLPAGGRTRHVQALGPGVDTDTLPILGANHRPDETADWDRMLHATGSVALGPGQRRLVIIDLGAYATAGVRLTTRGGRGASIRLWWAESLFLQHGQHNGGPKGCRHDIEGKYFVGIGDTFEPDGGDTRIFENLWWHSGRYLQCIVQTAEEPLTLESLELRHTGYPFEWTHSFECADTRVAALTPMLTRTLEACAHETYMDCPYYEQLMYVGDTRLQALVTYALSDDDRLPRKALRLFDQSRGPDGLTLSRHPSHEYQSIPPFSLWWVGMVHDHAAWRGDLSFVRSLMPGVRAVLDRFVAGLNGDGLLQGMPGWNFVDWCPGWNVGVPPDGGRGISGIVMWQLAWVLRQAAELEAWIDEPRLASHRRGQAKRVARATDHAFRDAATGLYADDLDHRAFSEHAQCMAILSGLMPRSRRARVVKGLLERPDLTRCTIYFMHYLFEVMHSLGRDDVILDRLGLWHGLGDLGLMTAVESPEPCRSDCHAWSTHPLLHMRTSLLGVRPMGFGFEEVEVRPALDALPWCRGSLPHPRGRVVVDLARVDGEARGVVELPPGVTGVFHWGRRDTRLEPGVNHVGLEGGTP